MTIGVQLGDTNVAYAPTRARAAPREFPDS